MIQRNPLLKLLRLIVTTSGAIAYDESFHDGVTVIRSEGNSRGKSTIAELIFFSLGGDLTDWKPEAGNCDQTFAEVSINGTILTLRRDIPDSRKLVPMSVYFGSFSEGSTDAVEGWLRLPYTRAGDKESFSQLLFRTMGIPDVLSDEANITTHQLLRLMYIDQMTPPNKIFRDEDRDSPYRRQAVGDLLCGALDERIYPSQIKVRKLDKEYNEAAGQFSGLMRVLRRVDEKLDFSDLLSRLTDIENRRQETLKKIEGLRTNRFSTDHVQYDHSPTLLTLRENLDEVSRSIVAHQQEIDRTRLSIEDALLLTSDLEKNIVQIGQSQTTGKTFGALNFSFCPSCFSAIDAKSDPHLCHLCKHRLDETYNLSRYARIRNEIEMQLRESNELQRGRRSKLAALEGELQELTRARARISDKLLESSRHFLTEADTEIEVLTREVGYFDRELVDIDRERRLAAEVQELASLKERLASELSKLRRDIAGWIEERDHRQASVYSLISRITAEILNKDVPSDIGSVSENDVRFSFYDNSVTVNDKRGYSASSLTVIKNAFHLALLFASCVDARMKYPKFLLIDNIEDKGMTPERSHNFQRLIKALSEGTDVEHQIIFTTSMVDPDLDHPEYTVGPKYTSSMKSLKMK